MTVQTQERVPPQDVWAAEDEIDLRQYLDVLIRWWREILLITLTAVVLTAVGILLMRLILPPDYEASADVAIVRTVSDVNFDERFRTNPEELGADTVSLSARRSALLGLVATGAIAQEVVIQLGDILSEEEQNPANLLEMVEAELASAGGAGSDSDLIRITVTADEPAKAAAIANAWARIYVREVNTIYGQVPNEVLDSIQTELAAAQEQYLTSQANLEAFVANNRIDELTGLVTVLQQRIDQEVSLQKAYLLQWEDTQEQLATVRALRTQVEQGGEGAARSNMAALQLLKMSAYGMPPQGVQVEVRDLPEVNQQAMLADLDGLLQSLEQRLVDLDARIGSGGTPLGSTQGVTSTLTSTLENLRINKAQLEAESAKRLQLTQQRDLSWDAYKTLSSKVAELNLTRAAASSEVRFGAPAVAPVEVVEKINLLLALAASGVLGVILSIIYAFLADYLDKVPLGVSRKEKAIQ
ncbi:MAG: Wzz/FepE/Etk N-terminal domain-containing protein [Caldilineaceae bacterium]